MIGDIKWWLWLNVWHRWDCYRRGVGRNDYVRYLRSELRGKAV
jgi:hypothetical protein